MDMDIGFLRAFILCKETCEESSAEDLDQKSMERTGEGNLEKSVVGVSSSFMPRSISR